MAVDHSWFAPVPVQHEFITTWAPEQVYAGGVGCVHPDTLIYDPVLDRFDAISDLSEPGHVLAFDGEQVVVAERSSAFAKGVDALYEFETEAGTVVATGSHLFLTPQGWRRGDDLVVGELLLGSEPCRLPSSSEHGPSVRREGDPHSIRTALGSRCGCRLGCRCGDARPRLAAASVRGAAPSRDDVLARSLGFPGSARARSRSCRSSVPFGRTGSPLAGDRQLLRLGVAPAPASAFAAHAPLSSRARTRSASTTLPIGIGARRHPGQAALSDALPSLRSAVATLAHTAHDALSCPHPTPLLSKRTVGVGWYWDLHVPVYENYWAQGLWNHNSGKTLSGGFKCLLATQQWPGGVGLVGRQTYRALEDTTKKVLLYGDDKPPIFTDDLGRYVAKDEKFICKNGSEILFRSLEDHNIEKLLSLNLAWIYVDEMTESTLKVWLTLQGRLRHPAGPGCAWGTTNPNGHDWVWKRFHPESNHDPDRRIWIQPTMSNPHLPPHYLRRMLSMPNEWQKRFVFASFETAAGMIWDTYDANVHVFDPMKLSGGDRFPRHWKRVEAMDHGRRNPTAWLWGVVDPDGNLIIEDEYYVPGLLPSEHAPQIRAQRELVAENIRWMPPIAPPDCFRKGNDGRTVADEYRDATRGDIILSMGNDNVAGGLLRVAEWFQRDPEREFPEWHPWAGTKGPDGGGAPQLFISQRCASLREEIPQYVWKDLAPAAEEQQNQPEEPKKLNDHACDALRYLVMSRPRPRQEMTADDYDRKASVAGEARSPMAGLIDMTFAPSIH